MVKKLTVIILTLTMVLSFFENVSFAISYNNGDAICNVKTDATTNCTRRFMLEYGNGNNNLYNKKWYLYNSEGSIYTDASQSVRAAFEPKNQSESLLFKVATQNAYLTYDATDYKDTWFYATSRDSRASLRIAANGTYGQSAVMTYETELTFSNEFAATELLIVTKNGTAYGQISSAIPYIKALSIDEQGTLIPDSSATMQQCAALTLGEKHKIAIVLSYTESSVNAGRYTYKKSVFLDENLLWSGDGNGEIDCDLKFNGVQMNITPWEIADESGYTSEAEGTSYTDSTAVNDGVYKHTLKATKFEMNTMTVYAGDTYELIPAYNSLDIIYADSEDASCVKSDVTLPTTAGNGTKVSWESSDEDIISTDGVINADTFTGYKKEVTLTATIKNSEETSSKTKTFKVTVTKNLALYEDSEIVNMELKLITFASLTDEQRTAVTKDITLPDSGELGCGLTWQVSECNGAKIDANKLTVTQSKSEGYDIVLKVTAEYGAAQANKEFEITIPQKTVDPNKYTLRDTMLDDSKVFSYSDDLGFTGKGNLNNDAGWVDGYATEPKTTETIPWMVYKFDSPIKGFSIDAIYTRRSDAFPTNFTFFVSNDASQWTIVDEDKLTVSIANTHNGKGYFPANFTCEDINFDEYYKYFKVVFGDVKTQGENARNFSISLDTVTVDLVTKCNEACNALSFDDLTDENADAVIKNLTLPTTGLYATTITWKSSNEAVVATDGKINHSAYKGYSTPVTLTAVIENDEQLLEKKFEITVIRDVSKFSAKDYVDYDLSMLTFDYITDQPIDNVVSDIYLPEKIEGGTMLSWKITDSETARLGNGILTFALENEAVTPLVLTVTSTYGSYSDKKDFNIHVMRGFGTNLLVGANVTASSDGARKVLSRDMTTYWQNDENDSEKTIYAEFGKETVINAALLVEKGSNISDYTIYASNDKAEWKAVYSGASNGDSVRKAVSFEEVSCKYVKLVFTSANPVKVISFELYNEIVTDEQSVLLSLEKISLPSSASTDLVLPLKGKYAGDITWKSADPSIITNKGIITRYDNESKTTILTATLTYNDVVLTKSFTVTVPGKIVTGGGGSGSSIGGGGGAGGTIGAANFNKVTQEPADNKGIGAACFNDVEKSHWAHEYIDELVKDGVISSDTSFRPNDNIKREEFIKLLVVAMGVEGKKDGESFTDIDVSAWYYPYIMTAKDVGIVSGNDDGTFGIGSDIKRQDAATMIYRLITAKNESTQVIEENSFIDGTTVSLYAAQAVNYLSDKGIINGNEKNQFLPFNNLTRAESAKIIHLIRKQSREENNAE